MKFLISFFIFVFAALLVSGCDSSTDSKSVSVNPPVLVQPSNNDTVGVTPLFKWTNTADRLEIDLNSSFSSPIFSTAVTGTEYQLASGVLTVGGVYFWRAGVTVGGTAYWSQDLNRFLVQ